jgi:hypothetical protein
MKVIKEAGKTPKSPEGEFVHLRTKSPSGDLGVFFWINYLLIGSLIRQLTSPSLQGI